MELTKLAKRSAKGLFTLLVAAAGFGQSIWTPAVSPAAITVNTPTTVIVTSRIKLANVIPGGVNVVRVNPTGIQSIVGELHDDGIGPDRVAGDNIYSGSVLLNEATTGAVSLHLSVAVRGSLIRVSSNSRGVDILPAGLPTGPITPDLSQQTIDPVSGRTIIANEVLACFAPTVATSQVQSIAQLFNGTIIGRLSSIGSCYQFRLPTGSTGATVDFAINTLTSQPGVVSAEPDSVRPLADEAPCVLPTCGGTYYTALRFDKAHEISTGIGVIVAVLDTGVDYTNPLLASHVTNGPNFTPDWVNPNPSDPMDFNGHGTSTAGVIAATAPDSILYAVRIFGVPPLTDPQLHTQTSSVAMYSGITWAADNFADILNMSYAGSGAATVEGKAVAYAEANGCVLVAAAGNGSDNDGIGQDFNPQYPAAYPGVVGVGAVRDGNVKLNSSDYGGWVQLAAPGFLVATTGLAGASTLFTGTSAAAPFVSGAAALLRSISPSSNATQIGTHLEMTATSIGQGLGYGLVNPVQTFSLNFAGTGMGIVTATVYDDNGLPLFGESNPDNLANLNCTASCTAWSVGAGLVTLAAASSPGSTFVGWSDDCSGSAKAASVKMSSDKACTATFTNIDHIDITPEDLTLSVGDMITLTATAKDVNNNPVFVPSTNFTWSSDQTSIASVDSVTGSVTGAATGKATISVTEKVSQKSATTDITVAGPMTFTPSADSWSFPETTVFSDGSSTTVSANGFRPGTFLYSAVGQDSVEYAKLLHDSMTCTACSDAKKIKWLFQGTLQMSYPVSFFNGFNSTTGTQNYTYTAQGGVITETDVITEGYGPTPISGQSTETITSVYAIQTGVQTITVNASGSGVNLFGDPSSFTQSGAGTHAYTVLITNSD